MSIRMSLWIVKILNFINNKRAIGDHGEFDDQLPDMICEHITDKTEQVTALIRI